MVDRESSQPTLHLPTRSVLERRSDQELRQYETVFGMKSLQRVAMALTCLGLR